MLSTNGYGIIFHLKTGKVVVEIKEAEKIFHIAVTKMLPTNKQHTSVSFADGKLMIGLNGVSQTHLKNEFTALVTSAGVKIEKIAKKRLVK